MGVKVDGTSPVPLYDAADSWADTYVVKAETSLRQIAEERHLDPAALAQANPQIKNPEHLTPGQEIHLPQTSAPSREQPEVSSDVAGQSSGSALPRAPIGDPIASSVIRANLSAKPSYVFAGDAPVNVPNPKPAVAPKGPERGGPLDNTKPAPGGPHDPTGAGKPGPKRPEGPQGAGKTQADGLAGKAKTTGASGGGPVGTSRPPGGPRAISVDEALAMAERGEATVTDAGSKSHQWFWEHSFHGEGKAPAAFVTLESGQYGSKMQIRIDLDYLEHNRPELYQRYKKLVQAQDAAKGAGTAGKAATAEKAPRHTKEGMGVAKESGGGTQVTGASESGSASRSGSSGSSRGSGGRGAGGVGDAGGGATKKGVGVGGDAAGGTKGAVATEKGMGVGEKGAGAAGKVAQGAEKTAEVAARGVGTAAKVAKVATGIADLLMPGPLDAGFMILDAFMATVDWKDKVIQQRTEDGFAVGMAAALVGASPEYLKNSHDSQPGIREGKEAYDKALKAGYDYVQSLPPEKRQQLHDAAFKQLAAEGRKWYPHENDPNKSKKANDDLANEDLKELAWMVGGTLGPTVEEVFAETRRAEDEKARAEAARASRGEPRHGPQ